MAATKERFQNPTTGDTLKLRLFTFNSNNSADVQEIQEVKIYFCDPAEVSESNPQGLRLVETISGSSVVREDTGQYLLTVTLTDPKYSIGQYTDVWTILIEDDDNAATVNNKFEIFPDLWFTNDIPIVYDFNFDMRPNRLRAGSKQYLIIGIRPNVPKATDLERYYANLAIVSPIQISIEQVCGDCMPAEQDLRLLIDCATVELREKTQGYYFLDTKALEMSCGIYNVWFQMQFGPIFT